MNLILKLVLSTAVPVLIGVSFNLYIFYYVLNQNVDQWIKQIDVIILNMNREKQQTNQIIINENQKLHNVLFALKTTIEISFNTIEQDLIKFRNFYYKRLKNKVIARKQFQYIPCSYRYYALNNCSQIMYKEFHKSNTFVQGFFHRTTFEFDEFSDEKKQRLKNIWDTYFLATSSYLARKNSLIAISQSFQAYDDSLFTTTPMLDMNLTAFQPYQTCITNQTFLENYDPRCRGWYISTVQQTEKSNFQILILKATIICNLKEQVYQYKPYKDAFTNTITMSGTAMLFDEKTNGLIAIIGMDQQISNLIQNILASSDELDESQFSSGYSLIFHEDNNTIFHHKYWQNTDDVEYSWQDIEYNSTTFYTIQEKNSFIQQVSNVKTHAESFDYNIDQQINTDQFYISFSKNNLSYYSLVYPINSLQQQQVFPNTTQNRIIICCALLSTSNPHRKFDSISETSGQLNISLVQKQSQYCKSKQGLNKNISILQEQENNQKSSNDSKYLSQEILLKKTDSFSKSSKINPNDLSNSLSQSNQNILSCQNKNQQNSEDLNISTEIQISSSFQKILDYEPVFQEIQIISQTFYHLQAVINYKSTFIDENVNFVNSILHFAKAKKMFQNIKNTYGQIVSLANIGYFQLQQYLNEQQIIQEDKYDCIIESLDYALQYSLYEIGINNYDEFKIKFQQGLVRINEYQDYLILNSINLIIILKCRLFKSTAFNMLYINILKNSNQEKQSIKLDFHQEKYVQLLNQSIQLLQFTEKVIKKLQKYSHLDQQNIEYDLIVLKLDIVEIQVMLSHQSNEMLITNSIFKDQKSQNEQLILQINETTYLKEKLFLNQSKYEEFDFSEAKNKILNQSNSKENNNIKISSFSQTINYYTSRLTYLKSLILFKQNQCSLSAQLLTNLLEDHQHLDKSIIQNAFKILNQIFIKNNLQSKYLKRQLNKIYHSQNYDLIFFIEAKKFEIMSNNQLLQILNELKSKFITKNDRISFYVYNNQDLINVFPLVQINDQKQWEMSIDTLKADLNKLCFSYYEQSQNISMSSQNDKLANQIVNEALNQIVQSNLINMVPSQFKNQQINQNLQKYKNQKMYFNRKAYILIFTASQNSYVNKLLNQSQISNDLIQKFKGKQRLLYSMNFVTKIILSFTLPIFVGAFIVLFTFYQQLIQNVNEWEQRSSDQQLHLLKQNLHNGLIANKLMIDASFSRVQQDLIFTRNLYKKFRDNKIQNKSFQFLNCSSPYQPQNKCSKLFYQKLEQNALYVYNFFHRNIFEFQQLPILRQQQLQNEWFSYIISRMIYSTRKNELFSIMSMYYAFDDSLQSGFPTSINSNVNAFEPYQNCVPGNYIENYDPRCRDWYILADKIQEDNTITQIKPYQDAFTGNIIITQSTKIFDQDGNSELILSIDSQISSQMFQLYSSLVNFDESSVNQNYFTLFCTQNNTVLYHKYFRFPQNKTEISLEDIEFNSTTQYNEFEKQDFIANLENVKEFMNTKNYTIYMQENIQNFYIQWSKDNLQYVGLFYPIQTFEAWSFSENKFKTNSLILSYTYRYDSSLFSFEMTKHPLFIIAFTISILLEVVVLAFFALNYYIALIYQIEIPIVKLTSFLNQNSMDQHQNFLQKNDFAKNQEQTRNQQNSIQSQRQPKKRISAMSQSNTSMQEINNIQSKNHFLTSCNQIPIKTLNERQLDLEIIIQQNNNLVSKQIFSQNSNRNINISTKKSLFSIQENKLNYSNQQQNNNSLTRFDKNKKQFITSAQLLSSYDNLVTEMKTLYDTFFLLNKLINYKSDSIDNITGTTDCVIHFAYSMSTFKLLNSSLGKIISLINLGYYQMQYELYNNKSKRKQKAEDIQMTLENAQQLILNELNYQSIQEFEISFGSGNVSLFSFYNLQYLEMIHRIQMLKVQLIKQHFVQDYNFLAKQISESIEKNLSYTQKYLNLFYKAMKYLKISHMIVEKIRDSFEGNNYFQESFLILYEMMWINILSGHVDLAENLFKQLDKNILINITLINLDHFRNISTVERYLDNFKQDQEQCLIISKLIFIKSVILYAKRQYSDVARLFTLLIEKLYYINPQIKIMSLTILNDIFLKQNINFYSLKNQIKKLRNPPKFDLHFFVESEIWKSFQFNLFSQELQELRSKLFTKDDRVAFYGYNKNTILKINPLMTNFMSQKLWEIQIMNLQQALNNLSFENFENSDHEDHIFDDQEAQSQSFLLNLVKKGIIKATQEIQKTQLSYNLKNMYVKNKKHSRKQLLIFIQNQQEQIYNQPSDFQAISSLTKQIPYKIKILHSYLKDEDETCQINQTKNHKIQLFANQTQVAKNVNQFSQLNQLTQFLIQNKFSK
ncbi:hypothetical protein ABPG73_001356 [Tetrahymena malaccensis]